jgi:hypothetical protein
VPASCIYPLRNLSVALEIRLGDDIRNDQGPLLKWMCETVPHVKTAVLVNWA